MVDQAQTIAQLLADAADGQPAYSYTLQRLRNAEKTLQVRTPTFRPTDPEYGGAIGDGSTHPLSGISLFAGVTTPAQLAAVAINGATPFAWASQAAYGLTFTKTTSAQTTSGTTLNFAGVAGDLANPMKFLRAGMTVSGTNIAGGTTISSVTITSGTPNLVDGPLAGTITLSAAVTGTVASGATITFSYSSSMVQALEIDWLAVQSAKYAADQAGGGLVFIPRGTYMMSRPIVWEDTSAGYRLKQSMIAGEGMTATCLNWGTDLGAGVWAMTPLDRTNSANKGFSEIAHIRLQGPGNGTTMGTAGCQMHGLAMAGNAYAYRILAEGWWSGINIVGDHQQVDACHAQNNYCNLFFAPLAGQNNGDQSFFNCFFDGSTWASIGCAGTNQITYALFLRCHGGFSPYGIYKWSGATTSWLIATNLIRCSFEACGNGGLYDENATGQVNGCHIDADWALDSSNFYEITARSTLAMIYTGIIDTVEFDTVAQNGYAQNYNRSTHPLANAIIQTQATFSNSNIRNAKSILDAYGSSFSAIRTGNAMTGDVRFENGGGLAGSIRTPESTMTAGRFAPVRSFGLVKNSNATQIAIVGFVYASPTVSTGAEIVPMVDRGIVAANKNSSSDVFAAGTYVQVLSTSNGSVVVFTPGVTTRTCVVGRVWNDSGSGNATVQIEVQIYGP